MFFQSPPWETMFKDDWYNGQPYLKCQWRKYVVRSEEIGWVSMWSTEYSPKCLWPYFSHGCWVRAVLPTWESFHWEYLLLVSRVAEAHYYVCWISSRKQSYLPNLQYGCNWLKSSKSEGDPELHVDVLMGLDHYWDLIIGRGSRRPVAIDTDGFFRVPSLSLAMQTHLLTNYTRSTRNRVITLNTVDASKTTPMGLVPALIIK